MIEFEIELGLKELYTLKNFSFDINNTGSADLTIIDVTTSSNNIQMGYIKTPFVIMINTAYTVSGYLKILNTGISDKLDYIDLMVSYINEDSTVIYDTYRYQLNYESLIYNNYTQILKLTNVNYINSLFVVSFDLDTTIVNVPNLILTSIDDISFNVFPKIYKLSDKKISYIFNDTTIKNKVIDSNIKFLTISDINALEVKKISYRSI